MVAREGFSDIALSISPEAYYTGIPGADVSRGMLYGRGKAEKLHADTRLYAELDERERQFNEQLAERVREYDESMGFGREQFDFFKEQYEDQYGLQQDYLDLAREMQGDRGRGGFDINDFLSGFGDGGRLQFPGGGRQYQYPPGTGPSYDQVGGEEPPNYYDPNTGGSVYDWLEAQPDTTPGRDPRDDESRYFPEGDAYPDFGGAFQIGGYYR